MNRSTSMTPTSLPPDHLAKRIFALAMIAAVAYVAAVIFVMSLAD